MPIHKLLKLLLKYAFKIIQILFCLVMMDGVLMVLTVCDLGPSTDKNNSPKMENISIHFLNTTEITRNGSYSDGLHPLTETVAIRLQYVINYMDLISKEATNTPKQRRF